MPTGLEAVRPIAMAEILAARERIAGTAVRTPLIRLELGPGYPDIRLKLENLQPINAYKLRGAANAVALLSAAERERGVWTISAGNAGQGVAYSARQAGVPCTVVVIETAPASKIERMRALGATLIPVSYEVAWQALEERSFSGDRRHVRAPVRRSRLHRRACDDRSRDPRGRARYRGGDRQCRRRRAGHRRGERHAGAEPPGEGLGRRAGDRRSPGALARHGLCRSGSRSGKASFVDGAGGQSVFPRMWERMQPVVDGSIVVGLDEVRRAMRLLAEKARVIAEGAGALAVAAALTGKAGPGPIVAIVSGGNIDLAKFCELIAVRAQQEPR